MQNVAEAGFTERWLTDRLDQIMAERDKILEAVRRHARALGHDRCWENDLELYQVCGVRPAGPLLPPIEEHRMHCDQWRAAQYDVPIEQEPCAEVARLRGMVSALADRVAEQSALLTKRAERES